jgi:hypothetical protein
MSEREEIIKNIREVHKEALIKTFSVEVPCDLMTEELADWHIAELEKAKQKGYDQGVADTLRNDYEELQAHYRKGYEDGRKEAAREIAECVSLDETHAWRVIDSIINEGE